MRDLFDDFMEELRRREALARGRDPDAKAPSEPSARGSDDARGDLPDDEGGDPSDDADSEDPITLDERDQADPDGVDGATDEEAFEPDRPVPIADHRGRGGPPRRRGPGGPDDGAGSRAGRAGRRFGVGLLLLGLLVVILLFSFGIDLWTDALWFLSIGFDSVFWTRLIATFGLGAGAFLLAAIAFLGNIWLAGRLAPPASAEGPGSLRSLVDRINSAAQAADDRRGPRPPFGGGRDRFGAGGAPAITFEGVDMPDLTPLAGWVLGGIALLLALIIGGSVSGAWETVLLWIHRVPFSPTAVVTDPVFGKDIGFFLFELPFLRLVQGLFNGIVLGSLVLSLVRYLAGASRSGLVFSTPIRLHLGILGGLFLLSVAFGYQLDKLELVYSTRGVATGVSFTDQNAQFLAFDVLTIVSGIAAALLVGGAFTRTLWPLGLTIAVWFIASLVVGRLYPEAVQRFTVVPNPLAQEQRYISNNIAMTRLAYDINDWGDIPFAGDQVLTTDQISAEADTFTSARLWDPRPLRTTLDQLQTVRKYYDFTDVDTDRYLIDGVKRQVMLSARELALDQNPQATGWLNQRIIYTHGVGAAMVPVNEVGSEGQPKLLVGDLPPASTGGAPPISQSRIYFGERPSSYVVVGAQQDEFDYPTGESDTEGSIGTQTRWTGTNGIHLDNTLMRLLFAARFRDLDLLISNQLNSGSQLLFHRSLSDRLSRIAPFLRFDKDPYLVIDDTGRMVYIQDAFTTSDRFPNAQAFDPPADFDLSGLGNEPFDYIRNSVKITIDAYDGTMHFYINDPADPIIRAYAGVFPGLFEPLSAMPADLRAHLRVPEDLFNVQTNMFGRYHVTNERQFFSKDDLWTVPGQTSEQTLPSEAYYVEMRLPNEQGVEFLLLQPMVPTGRPNMIAWVAARMDEPNYGQVKVYRFAADTTIFGPAQIEARIDQDPVISAQVSLWNQSGSKVIRGSLIVVPLDDTLIYLQPVYLQSTGSAFPEFKRIVVASPRQVVWADSLGGALQLLLAAEAGGTPNPTPNPTPGPSPGPGATPTPTPAPGGSPTPTPNAGLPNDVPGLIAYASLHYELAQQALRDNDFARYGTEIGLVGEAIQRLKVLAARSCDRRARGRPPAPLREPGRGAARGAACHAGDPGHLAARHGGVPPARRDRDPGAAHPRAADAGRARRHLRPDRDGPGLRDGLHGRGHPGCGARGRVHRLAPGRWLARGGARGGGHPDRGARSGCAGAAGAGTAEWVARGGTAPDPRRPADGAHPAGGRPRPRIGAGGARHVSRTDQPARRHDADHAAGPARLARGGRRGPHRLGARRDRRRHRRATDRPGR